MSLKALKKALKDSFKDEFPSGTVIRWVASQTYNYAAIKCDNGRWYTTSTSSGSHRVAQVLSFEDLVDVLSRSETSNVLVASEWTEVV